MEGEIPESLTGHSPDVSKDERAADGFWIAFLISLRVCKYLIAEL
jgi:hypothetical protein